VSGNHIKSIRTENKKITVANIFYADNEHTAGEIEQLIRMISLCNERNQKIIMSAVKTMLNVI